MLSQTEIDIEQAKIILASAIEEKKRRMKENGISYYRPQRIEDGYNDQEGFHKSTKRIRACFGGNRSGKTVPGACESVWYATGTHPYKNIPTPNFGRVCCTDFTNGIEKVILPEIKKWMPKNMIAHYSVESRTMTLKNESTIEFMSYDQDVEKFESASRHWIWFDEEPPENIFKACRMRIIDTKGDIWFTLTPLKGMSWIYSQIYEQANIDPNIAVWIFDTLKNPYIDEEEVEQIKRGLSDEEIEARIGGKFVQMSGLIYKEYNQDIHNIDRFTIPEHWPKICAIDPHPRLPTIILYMTVVPLQFLVQEATKHNIKLPEIQYGDVYIIYDEIYPSDPLLINETAELMRAHEKGEYISYRLIDNSAQTPDPIIGTTIRQEFEKYGIRTLLPDKDIANRILRIRERLKTNSLLFFKDLINTLWEIRHYAWDDYKIGKDYKDPKEKPRKKRDHAMDCLGYMVVSNPQYNPPRVYRPERKTINKMTGY